MLGCGLRGPDGNFVCHSIDELCPSATIQRILESFGSPTAAVLAEPLAPSWSTWAFEHGQIRFVERPDGWRLALVIRTQSDAAPILDPLSMEFLSLPLIN